MFNKEVYLKERHYSYLSAYGGYLFTALSSIAFWGVIGMLPGRLTDPSWSAEVLAQYYTANQTRMLVGAVFALGVVWLYVPLYSLVSQILEDQYDSPLASKIQLFGAILGGVFVYLMFMFLAFGAYRPDRDPDITQLMNDAFWFFAWWTVSTVQIQYAAIAIPIIKSKKAEIFPRWFGWLSVLVLLGGCFGACIPLFKTGPFAWNGAFVYFLEIVPGYFGLLIGTSYACVKALRNIDKQQGIAVIK